MIHALPAPVRGATHVEIEEAAINVSRGFCVLRGTLGTATIAGDALDNTKPTWDRAVTLQDADYAAFRLLVPDTSQLTFAALVGWIDQHALWGG